MISKNFLAAIILYTMQYVLFLEHQYNNCVLNANTTLNLVNSECTEFCFWDVTKCKFV